MGLFKQEQEPESEAPEMFIDINLSDVAELMILASHHDPDEFQSDSRKAMIYRCKNIISRKVNEPDLRMFIRIGA